MTLLQTVRRTIGRYGLAGRGTRVAVAVSGGPDSVALAHLLAELQAAGDLRLAGAVHFNHQLRDTAGRDEACAARVAANLGLPIVVDREDVAARAARDRCSIELAARDARYAFFARARVELDADVIALGHTRDDQAETYLLRLIRGAGARGLAAMRPIANGDGDRPRPYANGEGDRPRPYAIPVPVIRPLLDCRRADLRAYLDARGIAFVDDETNADVSVPRNRVRAELLPLLEQRFNPAIVDALAAGAALAAGEWEWMSAEADALLACASRTEVSRASPSSVAQPASPSSVAQAFQACDRVALDLGVLLSAPRALARLAVWRAMERIGRRAVAFDDVEAALAVAEGATRGGIDLPGQRVERAGGHLELTGRPPGSTGRIVRPAANLFQYSLSIPGEVVVAEADAVVSAELGAATPLPGSAVTDGLAGHVAIVRSDVRSPLAVRSRRPGDRFTPAGRTRTKLQDYFVDHRIERGRRDRVPIVVDADDRIIWVGGHAVDEAFRAPASAQSVLLLRLRFLGGPA